MDPQTLQAIQELLYSSVNGHTASSAGRGRLAAEGTLPYSDGNFTYGEVTPEGLVRFLSHVAPRPGEVFYDLGCGTGKGVIFASMMFPFSKCVGIELLPELWEVAQGVRNRFEQEVLPQVENGWIPQVEFRQGDFTQTDFSDADIVFAHATCFEDGVMQNLSQKFEGLKNGSRVVLVTKTLSAPHLQPITSDVCPFGWGDATVSCYHKWN